MVGGSSRGSGGPRAGLRIGVPPFLLGLYSNDV